MIAIALTLYSLSLITQAGTTCFAFLLAKQAPSQFKWGWIFLGIGLCLMLGRRISPILSILETNQYNISDAILSLPISGSLLAGVIGIHRLMSRLNAGNELLTALSQLDPLTQCLSRTECLFRLNNEIKRSNRSSKSLSILEIDIDHFKLINDEHGHAVGDEVLCSLTRKIKNLLRANDHLGRIGGEEFVVILPETDQESASTIAERIRKEIEHTVNFAQSNNHQVQLTISIGIATLSPTESLDPSSNLGEALLKQADDAMYKAKNNGRNQIAC